jgi:hypothetical protein
MTRSTSPIAVAVSIVVAVEVAVAVRAIAVIHRRAEHSGLRIFVLPLRLAEFLAATETLALSAALKAACRVTALWLRLLILNRLPLLLAGLSGLCTWTATSTTPPAASASRGWLTRRMVRSFTHISLLSCLT